MRDEDVEKILDYLGTREAVMYDHESHSTDAKTVSAREMYSYIRHELMVARHYIEELRR